MNNLQPLQTDGEFQALVNQTDHTELELGQIHHYALQTIGQSRRQIILEMMRAGWCYRIIQQFKTWQIDGSEAKTFDAWLYDPHHTFGLSHKWAYDAIRVFEISEWLMTEYNINLLDYLDVGYKKLLIIDRAIKKFGADKEKIEEWLEQGVELAEEDLKHELKYDPAFRGFGILKGNTLAIEYAKDDLKELNGKKVNFTMKERKKK